MGLWNYFLGSFMESKEWDDPSSAMLLTTKTTFWIFENSKGSFRSFTLLRGYINQSLSFMNAEWCCFLFWFAWRQCDIWQQKTLKAESSNRQCLPQTLPSFNGWDALEMAPYVKTMWSMHGLFPVKKKVTHRHRSRIFNAAKIIWNNDILSSPPASPKM